MVTFIIVRHGCSMYNKEGRFTGQSDIPLDSAGISQANDTAKYISEHYTVDKIYSSDLSRAVNTALPTAQALGLTVIQKENLREMDLGSWTDRLVSDIRAEHPMALEKHFKAMDTTDIRSGESHAMLMERAIAAIEEIAAQNDGKTVAVFTHGGFIRALLCAWQGKDAGFISCIPSVPNASITVVEYDTAGVRILVKSHTAHLTVSPCEGHKNE